MANTRQLAAIMFTDIEGFSAMMQWDEERAILIKDRHREVLEKEHKHFNGHLIQYLGDGSLSIFQSAVEAVQCAIAMQQAYCCKPKVPLRIGLHVGDVIYDGSQVFGDSVNIASRIESLGVPGSVLISDKVKDEISNHPEFKTYSVGVYRLKNIVREVEVFALDHDGLVKPAPHSLKGKTEGNQGAIRRSRKKLPTKSIAILPFVNLSDDPEQEYFSEGIGEEIINALSGLQDLKVAGRTSSSKFKGKNIDYSEVGGRLGVSNVLHGSVRKQGKRLRVTVQLTNVEDGFNLWSEKYDRNTDDIFAIQDEIAIAVTQRLRVSLLEQDRHKITKGHTRNTDAYDLYLKGRFYINKRGAYILTGLHCFQLAIEMDPTFALAHTGFADASLMAAFYGLVPPKQVMNQAKASAEMALKLDPSLCEPYCTLGCYYSCFEWNWEEAEKNFLRSLELNSKYVQAHYWYGSLFLSWIKGNFPEAEKHGKIATELEPLCSICHGMYASILHTAGKFDQAITACKTGIELDADSFITQLMLGWSYLFTKQYKEAIAAFDQLLKTSNRHHVVQNALIISYCITWKFDKARTLLNDLIERAINEYIAYTGRGFSQGYLEDVDEAFRLLEKAYEDREPMLLSIKYEHWVPTSIKEDPRYKDLLQQIGFPE